MRRAVQAFEKVLHARRPHLRVRRQPLGREQKVDQPVAIRRVHRRRERAAGREQRRERASVVVAAGFGHGVEPGGLDIVVSEDALQQHWEAVLEETAQVVPGGGVELIT